MSDFQATRGVRTIGDLAGYPHEAVEAGECAALDFVTVPAGTEGDLLPEPWLAGDVKGWRGNRWQRLVVLVAGEEIDVPVEPHHYEVIDAFDLWVTG